MAQVNLANPFLSCPCSRPEPRITWKRENGRPPSTPAVSRHNTLLTLDNLKPEDAGVYTCQGDNPDDITDSASHSFNVVIRGKKLSGCGI